jgi:hypothetical protein
MRRGAGRSSAATERFARHDVAMLLRPAGHTGHGHHARTVAKRVAA